jgi:hypothetical protein
LKPTFRVKLMASPPKNLSPARRQIFVSGFGRMGAKVEGEDLTLTVKLL